jgi:hypothetical protein
VIGMSFIEHLEEEPLSEVIRYSSSAPQDAVPFTGTLRKHPYDPSKCILLADPKSPDSEPGRADSTPAILEFRKADVQGVEELASPVDESGASRQLMRIWVRRGSRGLRYEPFDVDEPLRFSGTPRQREHVLSSPRG